MDRELIKQITKETLEAMGFEGKVTIVEEPEKQRLRVVLEPTNGAGLLIGRGGENLRALQHLLMVLLAKKTGQGFGPGEFILDVNDYQRDRENYLIALAKNTAQEVLDTKRPKELEPMAASERRLVHLTIETYDGVITESIGEKSERRVVVKLI